MPITPEIESHITHRFIPYLHFISRKMEAEWATHWYIDERDTIFVYGSAPHNATRLPLVYVTKLPLGGFLRYLQQNNTKAIIRLSAPPDQGNVPSAVPPKPVHPVETSRAVAEVGQQAQPPETPVGSEVPR